MKKSNIIKILIICIAIICIVLGTAFILNFKNSENKEEIYISGKNYENEKEVENNIEDDNNTNTEEKEEAKGTPNQLEIKETKEQKMRYANNEEKQVEYIIVDDFTLIVPEKLKEIGYDTKLTSNNNVLEINSKDNKYSCKIARFSNEECKLSKEQQESLDKICDEIAKENCNKRGIAENDERYKEIYNNEYSKINASNNKVLQFFNENDINRYTSFRGFTNLELENAWKVLGMDINNMGTSTYESYGRIFKTTYEQNETTLSQWEIGNDEYNSVLFQGLFLKTETFSGDKSQMIEYAVNFLVL